MRRVLIVVGCVLVAAGAPAGVARADFPWPASPTPADYSTLRSGAGDDGLCGRAAGYDVVTAKTAITPQGFAAAQKLEPAAAVEPVEAGGRQEIGLPKGLQRYVAVREVDEQGNVGRPAVLELKGKPKP